MKISTVVIGMMLLSALITSSCMKTNKPETTGATAVKVTDTVALIRQGEYLVGVMGCHDCHSPKRMGPNGPELIPELLLSGYPASRQLVKGDIKSLPPGWAMLNEDLTSFTGPWGRSFAANLTSDPTGIGNWTEDQFRRALTQGKYMGVDNTRMLLPPMPWQNFIHIKDEDLKAIFLYLKSTKPVNNVVPGPIPPNEL
jgi:hypothetical protein